MKRSIRAVVLVACIASPLGARGEGGARPQPRSEDPSAEVRHEAPWVEVVGVPPPSTLPLAGAAGKGPDGYPRQYVDRPALRSLLVNRRFAALTHAVERLQAAFEADPRRELWIGDAAEALGLPHQRERALLDEWVEASPRSFAPYLARATHLLETGFLHRGARYARDTSAFELSAMEDAFAQARRDAKRALALRPGLIEARELLIRAEIASGSREQAERQLEAALRRCPSCYELRAEWVGWALQPRWGGSLEEMERFAVERADCRNPRHRLLRGFLYQERGSLAATEGRRDEAMAAIDRACALGDEWRFLGRRAEYRRQLGDQAGRLADVERAAAARPGHPLVLFRRAWALADARRWEEAGRDLLYVLRSDPTSSEGIWLLPRVIRALDVLAWKAHKAGRAGEALRLYDLARLLAPADPGIAQRSEAVPPPGRLRRRRTEARPRPVTLAPSSRSPWWTAAGGRSRGRRWWWRPVGRAGRRWTGSRWGWRAPRAPATTGGSRWPRRSAPGRCWPWRRGGARWRLRSRSGSPVRRWRWRSPGRSGSTGGSWIGSPGRCPEPPYGQSRRSTGSTASPGASPRRPAGPTAPSPSTGWTRDATGSRRMGWATRGPCRSGR